jgi:segregation and condensation protein B
MSLKAKLEAVIYAAEEPVTLAQLAGLFAVDALEWNAEQEAARAAASEGNDQASEESQVTLLLALDGVDSTAIAEQAPVTEASPEAGVDSASVAAEVDAAMDAEGATAETADTTPAAESEAGPAADTAPAEVAAQVDAEAEAKKLARQRDRDVKAILRQLLDELIETYASDSRGVEIREIAGGYRMATKPECHDAVRMFVKSLKPAMKLSLPALETLAVIAYKQPVTAPEVNEIRGVDSSGVFGSLLARKLISTAGRKQVIGRPILYKTTKEFLLRFGLKDVSELPSMEEFEKMAAIELEDTELAESEPVAQEDTAEEIAADLSLELKESTGNGNTDESIVDSTEDAPEQVASTHPTAPGGAE